MSMTLNGAHGLCYLVTKMDNVDPLIGTYSMLSAIQMEINPRMQTFLVHKMGEAGLSKYIFNDIASIEEAQINITNAEYKANEVSSAFRYFMLMQVNNNPKKLVACSSAEDRDHWIRCFQLII